MSIKKGRVLLSAFVVLSLMFYAGVVCADEEATEEEIKTDEEIIAEYEWKVVASWEVLSDGSIDEDGLTLVGQQKDPFDGKWEIRNKRGSQAVFTISDGQRQVHLYYKIDDSRLFDLPPGQMALITIEMLDEGMLAPTALQYNSNFLKPSGDYQNWWRKDLPMRMGTQKWMTVQVLCEEARFANKQNFGADFRLMGFDIPFSVRKVTVSVVKN